jgi:peroxiredoxin
VVAISAEPASEQVKRGDWVPDGFVFIPDPHGRIISDWGLTHRTFGRDVSRPALYVLDGQGRVVWRHVTDNWRARPSPEDVLEAVRAAGRSEVP